MTYIRAYMMAVVNVLATFVFSTLVFIFGFLDQQSVATWLIRGWASVLLGSFGVRVEVSGEENLPAQGGGILVFNHQSHLDIPAICRATHKQVRFGAKAELFKIPVFGPAMRAIGTLRITRDNRNEVLRIYKEASVRFAQNILFVLAPEGTRQREPRIGRFKKGPFVFAIGAGVPLIPVVIKGAYEVLPPDTVLVNLGKWRRTIRVQFLPAIASGTYTNETLDQFTQTTHMKMTEAFAAL